MYTGLQSGKKEKNEKTEVQRLKPFESLTIASFISKSNRKSNGPFTEQSVINILHQLFLPQYLLKGKLSSGEVEGERASVTEAGLGKINIFDKRKGDGIMGKNLKQRLFEEK